MSGEITDVHAIANAFGPADRPLTIGLEEELMLLDPATLDLAPCAADVLARLDGDPRFVPELPAAQLEVVAPPAATVGEGVDELTTARVALARAAEGLARPAGGGVHPFASGLGVISPGPRYAALLEVYGPIMRRQLVFGLHVHVALGGPERVLPVYNALREELPAIAALAAGSPFYEGADTRLASVRPKLSELLPRQGVPPELPSWEAFAEALRWPARSFGDAGWWWELRPHPVHGTLEVRVADTQVTVADTAAIAAVVHALVGTLAERHDAGELPVASAPSWRIAENRWSACRHGVLGTWTDSRTGATQPTAAHLHELLDALAPAAARLGCATELEGARDLVERPRAEVARALGPQGMAAAAADRLLPT